MTVYEIIQRKIKRKLSEVFRKNAKLPNSCLELQAQVFFYRHNIFKYRTLALLQISTTDKYERRNVNFFAKYPLQFDYIQWMIVRRRSEKPKQRNQGVTIADVNEEFGQNALKEIENEFGPKKAIFVKTDVTNKQNFEEAFKRTIQEFKNIDILINNAGILNDALWEKEIQININGTINGVLLGLENYIPKYRSGSEGVIVNISSIAGIMPFAETPVYCATKFAVFGLTKSWGMKDHYDRTKVRFLALCPGVTDTPLITELPGRNLGPAYEEILNRNARKLPSQSTEDVARALIKIIQEGGNGSAWVVEAAQEAYEFILPERSTFAPK